MNSTKANAESVEFSPGFRISCFDGCVLAVGALAIALVAPSVPLGAVVLGFVLGHFFLFCNVFRISRPPELIWASAFVGLAIGSLLADKPRWPTTFVVCLLLSVLLVVIEMRRPSYHGVLWKRINPNLRAWYDSNRHSRR